MAGTNIIRPQAGFQEMFTRTNVDFCIGGGVLNSIPVDRLVATPNGFVRMGDIKANDVIINPFGGTQKVNFVLDKGEKECVEFLLENNITVESDFEHHWIIKKDNYCEKVTASKIINYIDKKDDVYFYINKSGKNKPIKIQKYTYSGKKHVKCINVSGEEHIFYTDNHVITCNCGKTFASVLATAELTKEKTFSALFIRNNLSDAKAGGGIIQTFRDIYGSTVHIVESGPDPHIDFPNGRVDITHVDNQDPDKIMQRFKGRQYDLIVLDEGTGYEWSTFKILSTRNRGKAKWTGHMLMTTNPEKDHWIRTFIDWYVGEDGFIREDRAGVVRYFYINGESVNDVVWGNSKEEVYDICKANIDRKLKSLNKKEKGFKFKWEDLIRSFTFYLGSMSENVASIGANSGYAGSVAMAGGRTAEQLIEGNWNVSTKGDLDAPITNDVANFVFFNDPQRNGDRWITADLADYGTDNFIAIVWDGFHIVDIRIVNRSTPRENAMYLLSLCNRYDVGESHVIFDATSGMYLKDYMPQAVAYYSMKPPIGMDSKAVLKLKDECYYRLVDMLNRRAISCNPEIGKQKYTHAKITTPISIQNEFAEECAVVQFRDAQSGKKALITKREMRQLLGKQRSTDLLDPIAMRMMPVLRYAHGDEMSAYAYSKKEEEELDGICVDVHDDTVWC